MEINSQMQIEDIPHTITVNQSILHTFQHWRNIRRYWLKTLDLSKRNIFTPRLIEYFTKNTLPIFENPNVTVTEARLAYQRIEKLYLSEIYT